MILLLSLLLVVTSLNWIANKMTVSALILYITEHGEVPEEKEIKEYTTRAAKKFFYR